MGPLHRTENKRAKLFQSVSKRCFGLKKLRPTYYCWTDPAEAFRLLSGDEDVCVKVVMLAKIKKCDSTCRSLVWLFGCSGWRVNRGSGRSAATVSPLNVSSWKPGAGELPSCSSSSRTRSHFTQSRSPTPCPGPLSLSLSASVCALIPLFLHSFPIPSPFLPSPLPAFWRYILTLSGACSSWPLLLRHFLCRLWRPEFGLINAVFLLFLKSNNKWRK